MVTEQLEKPVTPEDVKPIVETEVKEPKKKPVTINIIAERLDKIEAVLEKLLDRINLNDKPVPAPSKRNHNPDYLPKHGGPPVGLKDLPLKG